MPNSIGAGFRIVVAIVLTSWSGSGPSEVSAGDDQGMSPALRREGIRWPGEGGKKIRVAIGLYLVDFARINLRDETFDLAGYLA